MAPQPLSMTDAQIRKAAVVHLALAMTTTRSNVSTRGAIHAAFVLP
jgi:hypothetical protein